MSVKTIGYGAFGGWPGYPGGGQSGTSGNQSGLGGADALRGPSESIWGANGVPDGFVADFIQSPYLGMYFFDDFECAGYPGSAAAGDVSADINRFAAFVGSSASIADASLVGGVLTLTPGTAASNHPITLSSIAGCFQITSGSSSGLQGRLAFEARVALTSVTASKRDAFVGLMDQGQPAATAPFTAGTGTNQLTSTRNLIGFYNQYSGGGQDWAFVYQLASTAPVFVTGLSSLVSTVLGSAISAGTFYKLGFTFDPFAFPENVTTAAQGQTVGNTSRGMLRVWVNGIPAATFLTQAANILTSNFPTGVMGPVVSIMNEVSSVGASTNAGALNLDWVRVAQVAIS